MQRGDLNQENEVILPQSRILHGCSDYGILYDRIAQARVGFEEFPGKTDHGLHFLRRLHGSCIEGFQHGGHVSPHR